MRLQRQTIFGAPSGNCFATAVACVFDLDVADVPNFCAPPEKGWGDRFEAWCRDRGLQPLFFETENFPGWVEACSPKQVVIASGPAARGLLHTCVYRGGELLWDPHPDDTGLESVKDVLFFAQIEPRLPKGAE